MVADPALPLSAAELERAARVLAVRSRREVTSTFAGGYRSAFRGGGIEFEESRPYVPGDDVRGLDWNALARTGIPYVKRFREERDQTVWLAVDTSASMAFRSTPRNKAHTAAHAAALVGGAAGRAGDRVGLVTFGPTILETVEPGRGDGHLYHLLGELARSAARAQGATDLGALFAHLRLVLRRRSVVIVLSDFRDDGYFKKPAALKDGRRRLELLRLARHHDVVAAVVEDPRDVRIPAVGTFRVADPESPGRTFLLRAGSERTRGLYAAAAAVRRKALERRLRAEGADVLWLRTDRDPLRALAHFFRARTGRSREASA
jgi:uncharacterized protein (DUF58 family)